MEYFLLIHDFFIIKGKRAFVGNLIIPIILGLLIFYCSNNSIYIKNASTFHTNLITVFGILIGFTISAFTMLLTVNNENIVNAKSKLINVKLYSKEISLYDSVLIGLAYLILIQGFFLIANFIYPIFISIESQYGKIIFSINIAIATYIILILMRNILDFYFILTKK